MRSPLPRRSFANLSHPNAVTALISRSINLPSSCGTPIDGRVSILERLAGGCSLTDIVGRNGDSVLGVVREVGGGSEGTVRTAVNLRPLFQWDR